MTDAYAQSGVDPSKIGVFKDLMGAVTKHTALLPRKRGVDFRPLSLWLPPKN
jgi:hypothetical protein